MVSRHAWHTNSHKFPPSVLVIMYPYLPHSEHDSIVKEIRQFLDLPTAAEQDKATTRVLTQTGGRNIKKRRNN